MSETYTREMHCTHPDQRWCDCDWCRFLRDQQRQDDKERERLLCFLAEQHS